MKSVDFKIIRLTFFIGVLLVIFLRLWNLHYIPSDMEGDCVIHSMVSANLSKGEQLIDIFVEPNSYPSFYCFLYPLWQLFLGFMFMIFGISSYVVYLSTFIIFLITTFVFYIFVKEIFPQTAGVSTLLFVCSLWLFPYWYYGMGPFTSLPLWSILVLFFYYKMEKQKCINRNMFFTSLFLALAIFNGYAHILILYPVIFISNVLIQKGIKRIVNLRLLCVIFLSIFIYFFLIFLACRFLYHTNIPNYYKCVWTIIRWRLGVEVVGRNNLWRDNLLWIIKELFYKSQGEYNEGFNFYSVLGYPWISPVVGVLFIIGLVYSWIKRDVISRILNVWLFSVLAVYIFEVKPVSRYLIGFMPCIYIFVGIGLKFLYLHMREKFSRGIVYYNLLLILILLFEFTNFNYGFRDYYENSFNMREHFGVREASEYIEKDCKDSGRDIIVVFQDLDKRIMERAFHFYTDKKFAGKTLNWDDFKKDFNRWKTYAIYFVFPAKGIEFYGQKSNAYELQEYFPRIKPVWIVYFNNGTEAKYVYRLEKR